MNATAGLQKLFVYSHKLCSDCQALIPWLEKNGIYFELKDIRFHPENGEELRQAVGKEAVPFLYFSGKWAPGYQIGKAFDPDWTQAQLRSLGVLP